MELTTDVLLKGKIWARTIDEMTPIFKTRTNYNIFLLCIAIGIMYDQRIEKFDDDGIEARNVPRNVMQNRDNGRMDFMFQAAILSTKTIECSEDKRLDLAFGDKEENEKFNELGFSTQLDLLTQFANFGVTKLEEQIGDSVVETMDNIKTFLTSTIEGNNFDINGIPDDIFLLDDM